MRSNVWKMSSTKIDIHYDVTLASIISDIILGLSILGDDIFRTLERIHEYITLYTTLVYIINTNFVHVNTKTYIQKCITYKTSDFGADF